MGLSAVVAIGRRFVVIIDTRSAQEVSSVNFVKASNAEVPTLLATGRAGPA